MLKWLIVAFCIPGCTGISIDPDVLKKHEGETGIFLKKCGYTGVGILEQLLQHHLENTAQVHGTEAVGDGVIYTVRGTIQTARKIPEDLGIETFWLLKNGVAHFIGAGEN